MKKKLFFLLLPLGAVWWLMIGGCHKIDRDSVSGKVLEYGTEKPVEGAIVKLYGWSGPPLSGGTTFLVDSATTDANGVYHFDDDAKFARSMTANAYKSLYWTGYDSEAVVADGNYNNTNIYLKPYAWLNIKAINKNGQYFYFRGPGNKLNGIKKEYTIAHMDSITYIRELEGNFNSPFQFGIRVSENTPPMQNTDSVILLLNKQILPVILGSGLYVNITPLGHDTTNITIIF